MKALVGLVSVAVVGWVLLVGSLADFDDTYARTAFAFGIAAAVPAFLASAIVLRRVERA